MPNPKRRHSKTRTAKRRTHDALTAQSMSECPQCGTNFNTGTCTCDTSWQDPRLAALKDLKTRES